MPVYLVPIDCSAASKGALEKASERAVEGDRIVVLSMYTPPSSALALAVPTFESSFMRHQKHAASEEERKHSARKLLYKAKEVLSQSLGRKRVTVEYVSRKTGNKKKEVNKVIGTHKVNHTFIPSPSDQLELFTDEAMLASAKYLALGKLSKEFSSSPDVTIV